MTRILILLIFLVFSAPTFAIHNSAGEITFKKIGENTIEATIHTYSFSGAPSDRDSLQLCWGDGACEPIERDSFEILMSGRQHNWYSAIHEYADFGEYSLYMSDPNRNAGVINLPFGDMILFHLQTTFVLNSENNTGPVFLENPFPLAYVDEPYFHIPNAWDADGDSLAFRLEIPYASLNTPVFNYNFPNEVPVNGGAFGIDEITGTIGWLNPEFQGTYVVAFVVDEYRNGVLISSTLRDMEIDVLGSTTSNMPPSVMVVEDYYEVAAGEIIDFDVAFGDPDSEIMITGTGGPLLVDNPAIFNFSTGFISPPQSINFQWETTMAHIRDQPYYMVFTAVDDSPEKKIWQRLVEIYVRSEIMDVHDVVEKVGISVSPNPSTGNIFVEIEKLNFADTELVLYNSSGMVIWRKKVKNLETEIDLSGYARGFYFLKFESNGRIIGGEKIVLN